MEAFERGGLSLEDLSFVKRRGRINLEYGDKSFSYLLIKKTEIGEKDHNWVQTEFYRVWINNGQEQMVDSWPSTLQLIKDWMAAF